MVFRYYKEKQEEYVLRFSREEYERGLVRDRRFLGYVLNSKDGEIGRAVISVVEDNVGTDGVSFELRGSGNRKIIGVRVSSFGLERMGGGEPLIAEGLGIRLRIGVYSSENVPAKDINQEQVRKGFPEFF